MLYHEHVMIQMVINAMFRFEYVYNCFLQMHGIWLKTKSLYGSDLQLAVGKYSCVLATLLIPEL